MIRPKLFIAFFLSVQIAQAQKVWHTEGFKGAIGYQNRSPYIELGVIRSRVDKNISTLFLSSEIIYNSKQNEIYLGPKVGYEFFLVPGIVGPGCKLSIIDYTTFRRHKFYIVPEASIHVIGSAGLMYGYNFPFNKESTLNFSPRHKVSLFLNLQRVR